MDKQVFLQNLELVRRRKALYIRLGASLLFITLCTSMWLTKTSISPRGFLLFKGAAIACFAALAYGFITRIQKLCKRLGLHCPGCNRNLSGPQSPRVLASGQCHQCGMKLF
jgi:hypothetical protein